MPRRSYSTGAFTPTPSVRASRERTEYVACSVCGEPGAQYLFFRRGVRFVRCTGCGLVYVSPVGDAGPCYFDIPEVERMAPRPRRRALHEMAAWLAGLGEEHAARHGGLPRRSLLLGRYFAELGELEPLRRLGLEVERIDAESFEQLSTRSDLGSVVARLAGAQLVILNELLEACADPGNVLGQVAAVLEPGATVAIAYADAGSLPARLLRRHWPTFFDMKRAYFGLPQLSRLAERHGLVLLRQTPLRLRAGVKLARFEKRLELRPRPPDRLSIVLPVYQEATTIRQVIDLVLEKPLRIEKELIVVESGSRDGTREIVREYEGRPGVRVLYEPEPRGKGHAVRTGLAACTGSIVLIQDADLEYDVDDYDALLEPILQGRASFVLGSRTLGAGDWKVRRFASGAVAAALLNVAQVGFAKTFNALYQQRTTDVNTMFKVFRRSCLHGLTLESDGFELDIELTCKLVLAGHAPLEVPVNYVARDFSQGKKIRFWRDAWPGYAAFFKYRFSQPR